MSAHDDTEHVHVWDNGRNDDGSPRMNAARHCTNGLCFAISLDYDKEEDPCETDANGVDGIELHVNGSELSDPWRCGNCGSEYLTESERDACEYDHASESAPTNGQLLDALRAEGLSDVEEWMTGGNCRNVVVILNRGGRNETVMGRTTGRKEADCYLMFGPDGEWVYDDPVSQNLGIYNDTVNGGYDSEGLNVRPIHTLTSPQEIAEWVAGIVRRLRPEVVRPM